MDSIEFRRLKYILFRRVSGEYNVVFFLDMRHSAAGQVQHLPGYQQNHPPSFSIV
jgi:hypothetical protein